jgi:hypothetical protein
MKKQIISLLLLTSLIQAENFYLGYNFLTNGTNNVLDQNTIRWELSNPLRTEPVFMVLHKDLLDTWKGN